MRGTSLFIGAPSVEPKPLGLAVGLAALGFAIRLAADPLLGEDDTYIAFYPLVTVAALFLGPAPAALVTGLGAISGYVWFGRPEGDEDLGAEHLTPLALFVVSSVLTIVLLVKMRRAMAWQASARREAEALATDHAVLFGEMNARVTNHLQLIAGLLQLHARNDRGPTSRAFEEASAHTLLISKLHRDVAGDGQPLDFRPLVRRLVDSAAPPPNPRIEISPGELWLRPDQATSAAVVLLERLRAHQAARTDGSLRINLRTESHQARIELVASSDRPLRRSPLPRLHFIEAMVEQLGGRFQQRQTAFGSTETLAFPLDPPATDQISSQATLH
ncbi:MULTISPECIES: DUF4118 domain-containing protein [Phenylobacterium]|uniref:Two-component sensor histidine kinase n=1 Tax=Phenylobacterium koreense TaxID=266125 RepID=A0ABV2EF44_9CAUL